jgi:predicted transcriptional regulator
MIVERICSMPGTCEGGSGERDLDRVGERMVLGDLVRIRYFLD